MKYLFILLLFLNMSCSSNSLERNVELKIGDKITMKNGKICEVVNIIKNEEDPFTYNLYASLLGTPEGRKPFLVIDNCVDK